MEVSSSETVYNFLKFLELRPVLSEFNNYIESMPLSTIKTFYNAERNIYVVYFNSKLLIAHMNNFRVETAEIEVGEVLQMILFQRNFKSRSFLS